MTNTTLINNCVGCHHAAGDPIPGDGGIYDASGGGVKYGNLDLAASVDAAYAALVNEPAMGDALPPVALEPDGALVCDTLDAATPGHIRVVPDAAGQSLLCLKIKAGLDGSPAPCGAAMPLSGNLELPDGADIQQECFTAVQQWINEGANP
ncbi:MAG TPA: hypothetical protein VEK07_20580 [Polyangiaceae bacterium]|nr:hypothetical protein [Polyangiaceae bacterium]